MGFGTFRINFQSFVAHLLLGVVVFTHIGHIGHTQPNLLVIGLGFGETTEILVGALEVAESQISLGEIVTGLKVIMYLERMFKALYRIIVLTHTEGAHAVVLEHIKFLTLVIVVLGGSIVTTQA